MAQSQTSQAKVRMGMRMKARKRCQGRRREVVGGGAIGKKGAMPEPGLD